MMIAWC
jgi:hypothetical protein